MFMSYILPDEIMCIHYSQMSSEKSENIYIIFHVSFINNGKGGALIVKNKFIYTKVKIYMGTHIPYCMHIIIFNIYLYVPQLYACVHTYMYVIDTYLCIPKVNVDRSDNEYDV